MVSLKVNTQPPEPFLRDGSVPADRLEVVDVWYTIQGEGPLAGTPAVFVRLAGCNMQCPGCDTDYTSTRRDVPVWSLVEMVKNAALAAGPHNLKPLVVLTGGEPLRQPCGDFARELLQDGFPVQVETNGAVYRDDFPWAAPRLTVVVSPKASRVHPRLTRVDAWKYVLRAGDADEFDGLPKTVLGGSFPPARPPSTVGWKDRIFVQPLDEGDEVRNRNNEQAVAFTCLRFGYRAGIQMHKYLGLK